MADKCAKGYLLPDGTVSRHARPDAVAVVFKFANGENRTLEPGKFAEPIQKCYILMGIAQKHGDKFAGAESVEEAVELFDGGVESCLEGRWLDRAEGVTRSSDLALVMVALKPDKYPDVAAAVAAIKGWSDADRKARESLPAVQAKILEIRTERMLSKAEAARKAALAAGATGTESL